MDKFASKRNINQLIVEHIPAKMAKQISDKRRPSVKGHEGLVGATGIEHPDGSAKEGCPRRDS